MESPKQKSNEPSTPDSEGSDKKFMRFYGLAFELVIMNLILILGGYYLDSYLSTSPIMILLGTFLAMAGTIWLLLRTFNK